VSPWPRSRRPRARARRDRALEGLQGRLGGQCKVVKAATGPESVHTVVPSL
jgi:hypothetical protein